MSHPRPRVPLLVGLSLLVAAEAPSAQEVTTEAMGFPSRGDVAATPYSADGGEFFFTTEGPDLYHRDLHGSIGVFATGLGSTRGVVVDETGDVIYVADLNGRIWQVPRVGTKSILATGIPGVTGLALGPDGHLYAAAGSGVHRVLVPSGDVELLVGGGPFNRPNGIAVGPSGILYVASAHDGNVWEVTFDGGTPTIELLAHVDGLQQPWACGYMGYGGGSLFITNGDNKVHRITVAGEESTYAGTGDAGWVDGPAETAEFTAPNGIGVSPDGSRVFVAEYGVQRVRLITATAVDVPATVAAPDGARLLPATPNPFLTHTTLRYELVAPGRVSLAIFDVRGRHVRSLLNRRAPAGSGRVSWDGTDAASRRVAAGVYLVRLDVDGVLRTTRIHVTR